MSAARRSDDDLWASIPTGRASAAAEAVPLRFAFYGRCSTEDMQDPKASLEWQLHAAKCMITGLGLEAEIVSTYFDIGQSRVLPWKRRNQGVRLLDDLASGDRLWNAVIVGEGQRCWYGTQFAEVAPLFEHYGVSLYVPDLSGPYDPRNPTHFTMMSVSGGMSRAERQRVQDRTRAGMEVQVESQGRFQGGRAPYGYRAEGFAPHPNQRKANEGAELKRLVVVEAEAAVVRRIFGEFLSGRSLRDIARRLNGDGIAPPSVALGDKSTGQWHQSTLGNILSNPRYTGYEVWGRQKSEEFLADPKDPSMGTKTRFVKNQSAPTRSRDLVHEAIIDLEEFARTQMVLASKAEQGPQGPHIAPAHGVTYPLRGLIFCETCGRSMGAEKYGKVIDPLRPTDVRYRCRQRDLTNDNAAKADHPTNVRIKQADVLACLQEWFGALLAPAAREVVLEGLQACAEAPFAGDTREGLARARLNEVEVKLGRLYKLIEGGGDPGRLVTRLNALGDERDALRAELDTFKPEKQPLDIDAMATLLDQFATSADEVFGTDADYSELHEFFSAVGLRLDYNLATDRLRARVTWGLPEGAMPDAVLRSMSVEWMRVDGRLVRVVA